MIRPEPQSRERRRTAGRGQRRAAGAVLLAVLTIGLGACGGAEESPGVATAAGPGGATASATAAGGLVAQYVEQSRAYARCLREQGLDVPDPDAKGEIDFTRTGLKKTDPKYMNAMKSCGKLLTIPVPDELEEKPPPLTEVEIERRREYAKCTRESGVPSFQDPGPDGQWPDSDPPGMTDQEAAASLRAQQICEPLLDGKPRTTPDPNRTALG